jgi:transcriptional regulator with XRE-family HTH domain
MESATIKVTTKHTTDRNCCVAFGKRLSTSREIAGLTQAGLARQVAVTRSAVAQWELGNSYPVIDKVRSIADAIRVTPEYLLFGTTNNRPQTLAGSIPLIDRLNEKLQDFLAKHQGQLSCAPYFKRSSYSAAPGIVRSL